MAAVVLAALAAVGAAGGADAAGAAGAAPGTEGAGERLRRVETELREAIRKAGEIEGRSKGVLGEVETLDRRVAEKEADVARIAAEVAASEKRRREAEREVARLRAEEARLREAVLARAAGLHRLARRGWGPVVLSSPGSLSDSLRHRRYLAHVLERDREQLEELAETRRLSARREGEAEAARLELVALERVRAEEVSRLRARRSAKRSLLASLRREADEQGELRGELEAAAGELRRLIEEAEARAEAERREREAAERLAAASDDEPGELLSPLEGPITKVAAVRNGVEIRAPRAAVIRAVAGGRVVFADWFPGYGRMVIVDHGGQVHSIYGYAEDLLVSKGDAVRAGAPIARVGSTGLAPSARLYFEIREAGEPRDPRERIAALK